MAQSDAFVTEEIASDFVVTPGVWITNNDVGVSILNSGKLPITVTVRQVKPAPPSPRCEVRFDVNDCSEVYCDLLAGHDGLHSFEWSGQRVRFEVDD